VDVSSDGLETDAATGGATVSADGRFVAFSSEAADLVPGDGNGVSDVFVRDLRTGRTTRVSVSSAGVAGDRASTFPSLSADGRLVAFRSFADNLVGRDRNGVEDVFVHDRVAGTTERVSVGTSGQEANGPSLSVNISADGSAVAFSSTASNLVPDDRNGVRDVFVRDRARRRTERVSVGAAGEATGKSEGSSISAHGRVVAFRSLASNLVPGDTNGSADDFVRDRARGITERVDVSSAGAQADAAAFRGSLSGDGRLVAFRSRATNLVPNDTNRALDVFVRDRVAGTTRRISVTSRGAQADARGADELTRRSLFMSRPFVSADGRYAAFGSRAPNLVRGDTNRAADVFVADLERGCTLRVSVGHAGAQANSGSFVAGISGDGRVVVFRSFADNLVPGDANGRRDVFVRIR
jgi:Tol biopolymer transport system component